MMLPAPAAVPPIRLLSGVLLEGHALAIAHRRGAVGTDADVVALDDVVVGVLPEADAEAQAASVELPAMTLRSAALVPPIVLSSLLTVMP